MKRTTLYCDRCGEECEYNRNNHGFHLYGKTFILTRIKFECDEHMDLCQKCYDELAAWYSKGNRK